MFDLSNVQGNILRGYASFPYARFLFLEIHDASAARALLQMLIDQELVTPGRWRAKPDATLNIAVTFAGRWNCPRKASPPSLWNFRTA